MSDVIRLARHARQLLPRKREVPPGIFDKGKALALYHAKRLTWPARRIVLYAKECSGCALVVNP
jgi:hypothetical protein